MSTQFAPAASQRRHCTVKASGLPPFQTPGTTVRSLPASGDPTMLGAVTTVGVPCGNAAIASDAGLAPCIRSPSTQWETPGTETQSVHCQNVQPWPFQSWAGTHGLLALVQCAIQSGAPAWAIAVESARYCSQKAG